MPKTKTSDLCKVCGSLRDGKPGLYCQSCRKSYNLATQNAFREKNPMAGAEYMRKKREGLTEQQIEQIRLVDLEYKRNRYASDPDFRSASSKRVKERLKLPRRALADHLVRYGLNLETYDKLLISQSNGCAICKKQEAGGRGSWHVDHCHLTGAIRGLLCHSCNTSLGHFKDSIEILESAIAYLKKSQFETMVTPAPISVVKTIASM